MLRLLALSFLLFCAASATPLNVDDRPLVYRTLVQNTPTRGIAVGYPSQFNYAIDSVTMTPLYVWSGGFLDLKNELNGRGGKAVTIRGPRIDLGFPEQPLRFGSADSPPPTVHFKGYRRPGREAPVFSAEIAGEPVRLSLIQSKRNQVTLRYAFSPERRAVAFFRTAGFQREEVVPGPGVAWTEQGAALRIPVGMEAFEVTLNLSGRTARAVEKEVVTGASLYAQFCSACHSLDGHKLIGPTFKGLWGKKETVITAGKKKEIVVDAAYLKRAIVAPQADIVEGYALVPMPGFEDMLSAKEIELLVDFIKGK